MATSERGFSQLSDQDRLAVEGWLAEFDQSWDEHRLAGQVQRLPAHGLVRRAALAEMIKIDLERQWQAGRRVEIEAYLKAFPELGTPETVPADLVLAEYEVRRQFGPAPTPEEFVRRFPHQAEELRRHTGQPPRDSTAATHNRNTPPPSTYSAAARTPALPVQFGRYRIQKELGRGGMGSVYLAHDSQLDRLVALKVPHFSPEDGRDVLERFYREARASATLDHPNICPVYDVSEVDGMHYVTMAYIEGKPLAELIRPRKPLPQRSTAAVLRKLALALHEAHQRGIIHRDLKPSNIMINKRGEPVVLDFGLARRAQDVRLTNVGAFLGTPAYMSPEQASGDVEAMGPGCDIYSLGVVLYEMLAGELPFQGPLAAVVGQILTQEPMRPSLLRRDLDPDLEAICLKAMAKKVKDRYAGMAEFAAALTRYLKKGEGATAPPGIPVPVASLATGPHADPVPTTRTKGAAQITHRAPDGPVAPADTHQAGAVRRSTTAPPGEPRPDRAPPRRRGPRRPWVALAAMTLVALIAIVAVIVLVLQRPPGTTDTTVVVRLEGIREAGDPNVVVLVGDQSLRGADLDRPLRLEPGKHRLIVKRGEQVVALYTVEIGARDEGRPVRVSALPAPVTPLPAQPVAIAGGEKKPPVSSPPPHPDPTPVELKWDVTALEKNFTIVRKDEKLTEHVPSVTWLLKARRLTWVGISPDRGGQDFSYRALFYDGEGVKLSESRLNFEPTGRLDPGAMTRATLTASSGKKVFERTMHIVIQGPNEDGGGLARPVTWDLEALKARFQILETSYDPKNNAMTWLLEARIDTEAGGLGGNYWGGFYDADNVQVGALQLHFEPSGDLKKGARARATLSFRIPFKGDVRGQTTRAVIEKR
jgi:predicted Ser/Thr protein kinase